MLNDDVFRLKCLADWFDVYDKKREVTENDEVQRFLRDLANRIDKLINKPDEDKRYSVAEIQALLFSMAKDNK